MPGEVEETLLKFRGDASEVAAAAQQAKDSIQGVKDAADSVGSTGGGDVGAASSEQAEGVGALTGALEQNAQASNQADEAAKNLANSMGDTSSEKGPRAYLRLISLINPAIAELGAVALHARTALTMLFSPVGLLVAGTVAAIGMAVDAISGFMEDTKRALELAKEFADAQQKLRTQRAEGAESAAEALAKGGISSPEAVRKGAAITQRFESLGYSREAIGRTLSYAVDASGKQTMTDAELETVLAHEEYAPSLEESANPRERGRSLRSVERDVMRNPELAATRMQAVRSRIQRLQERARSGEETAIRELLTRQEGLSGAALDKAFKDVSSVMETGQVEFSYDTNATHSRQEQQLLRDDRQIRAAERLSRLGIIGQPEAKRISDYEHASKPERDVMPVPQAQPPKPAVIQKPVASQPAQGAVFNIYGGTVNVPSGYSPHAASRMAAQP